MWILWEDNMKKVKTSTVTVVAITANKISFGERFNNVISRLQNVRF